MSLSKRDQNLCFQTLEMTYPSSARMMSPSCPLSVIGSLIPILINVSSRGEPREFESCGIVRNDYLPSVGLTTRDYRICVVMHKLVVVKEAKAATSDVSLQAAIPDQGRCPLPL